MEYSVAVFYHFWKRFILKMPGSLIWPIKHHKSDFFQRLMELPENVPRRWLLEISSYIFLPMRITAGFPMMRQARGFFLLFSWQARNPSIHLAGPPKGYFLSSVSQNRWSIPQFNQSVSLLFFLNLSRGKVSMIFSSWTVSVLNKFCCLKVLCSA